MFVLFHKKCLPKRQKNRKVETILFFAFYLLVDVKLCGNVLCNDSINGAVSCKCNDCLIDLLEKCVIALLDANCAYT